jgi:hypothetical protein
VFRIRIGFNADPDLEIYEAVLGIRDILVRIRICGSVPLTNGSRNQLRIRLLSSLTPRMQKKILITYPQAHNLQSQKFNFLIKFLVKILFCKYHFSTLITFIRKWKDPDLDPYL